MIAAFEGWNDAGESATGAVSHLLTVWTHQQLAITDPEEYYDFQVNRPSIRVDAKVVREIIWPNTIVYAVSTPHLSNDFLIVKGIEPSMRWRRFADELLDLADDYEVQLLITMGALLADAPHSRPIGVTGSGSHPDVAERLGVERPFWSVFVAMILSRAAFFLAIFLAWRSSSSVIAASGR